MIINVTKEDIRLGRRNNCERCPIARAIKRVFRLKKIKFENVQVFNAYARWWSGDKFMQRRLPAKCDKFIDKFDDTFDKKPMVKPFKFRIGL
jgi:hypothetical protein